MCTAMSRIMFPCPIPGVAGRYTREEVLGKNCRFLQGPNTSREAVATLRSAVAAQRNATVELLNYKKNGEHDAYIALFLAFFVCWYVCLYTGRAAGRGLRVSRSRTHVHATH
jgi:hypothetical protein